MKSKRIFFFGTNKKVECFAVKPSINVQANIQKAKLNVEHNDLPKQGTNDKMMMERRNSLNKCKNNKKSRDIKAFVSPYNKRFECTYYGQGFKLQKPLNEMTGPEISTHRVKLNPMHKTSTNWEISNKLPPNNKNVVNSTYGKKGCNSRGGQQNQENSGISNFVNKHNVENNGLPFIENKERSNKFWQDIVESPTEDIYIKSIATSRISRAAAVSINRPKGTLLQSEINTDKERLRIFNWEGIHFEISPKRNDSTKNDKDLQKEYSKELNLMSYNFNDAINRNSSDSPKESKKNYPNRENKRVSKNISLKERNENNNNSISTNVTNNEERVEKSHHTNSNKGSMIEEDLSTTEDIFHGVKGSPKITKTDQKNQDLLRPPSPVTTKCTF